MADVNVSLNLSGLPPTLSALHIHIEYASDIVSSIREVGSNVSALDDKVNAVVSGVSTLLTNTAELVKDVQRLLSEGDTSGAQAALDGVAANLATANENIQNLDASVESASPEPTTPETPETPETPTPESPLDNL